MKKGSRILTNSEKEVVEWLKRNKDILSISALEEKIGCPLGTLQKASTGSRSIPSKWIGKLYEHIKNEMSV